MSRWPQPVHRAPPDRRASLLALVALLATGLLSACAGHAETTLLQGGKTAFAAGHLTEARAYFEEQLQRYPQGVWCLTATTYLARIQLKQGDAEGALARLDAGRAGAPADALGRVGSTYWRGRITMALHRDVDALAAFSQVAASTSPEADAASYFQGRVQFRLGAYDAAVATLRARLQRATLQFVDGTHYWLGRALYAGGQYDGARPELAAVAPASTWRPGAELFLLRCDVAQEQVTRDTADQLHRFGAEHPGSTLLDLAALAEGQALVQLEDFQAARALLSTFPQRWAHSPSLDAAAFWSARAALGLQQPAVARAEVTALLARQPSHNPLAPGIHVTLGEAFRLEGGLNQAQVELEKMLARSPTSRWVPEAHHALAQVYTDLHQCPAARLNAAAIPTGSRWSAMTLNYLTAGGC